jgi:hypothetical protein
MPINRNPKSKFTRISNSLVEELPLNIIGLVYYFLSKPPGWKMKFDDLLQHWSASELSLRRNLRELRKKDFLVIKPYYDIKKKRFAGSYYRLKESSDNEKFAINVKNTPGKSPEQTHQKNRVSAITESLQNREGHNKNDILNINTDNRIIDSNTYTEEDLFDDEKNSGEYSKSESNNTNSLHLGPQPKIDTYIPELDDRL